MVEKLRRVVPTNKLTLEKSLRLSEYGIDTEVSGTGVATLVLDVEKFPETAEYFDKLDILQ